MPTYIHFEASSRTVTAFPRLPAAAPHQRERSGRRRPASSFRALLRTVVFVFLALATTALRAQSVHWENGDSGDPSDLQLVFQDCVPEGDPQVPRIEGTTLSLVGTSSQTVMNNFTFSRSTILTYRARAQQSGAVQIPSFTVQTNKGAIRVPAFTGGTARSAADANVTSRLEPGSRTVWAGEIFPLSYVLDVSRRSFNQLGTNIEWNPAPLVIEDWSKFEPIETTSNGEARLNITAKTRAYAKTPGGVILNPATQLVNLQSGSIGFGLFQTPRIEQLSVTSDRPAIVVRPLPAPAPAGFNGAVGQFKLTSKVVPTTAAVGEPVTWTLELTGTGNWPDIPGLPQREVSKDFRVVQPKAKRTTAEGKLFDSTLTEDVVLVPTEAGSYTLGPLNFVYFDPASGSYKTIRTPQTTVTISPPAGNPTIGIPTAAEKSQTPSSAVSAPRSATPPPVPAPPGGIPRDPLPGSGYAIVPLKDPTLVSLVLLPFVCLPLLWGWLAIRRAQQTDPVRPRREARQRLAATIERLRTDPGTRRAPLNAPLLLQWQHDAAVLWQIPHAAPSAAVFATIAPAPAAVASAPGWSQLWAEADRALYSAGAELPADWPERAAAALTAVPVRGFRPWTACLPRNLFPFVAAVAVALVISSAALAQATPDGETATTKAGTVDPAAAYRRGDFSAAEKSWAAAVEQTPTDPIARHNLSLALAQQDRWGESAANAAAAFIQDPTNPPLRAQLALASEKAGYIPAPLAGFLQSNPLQSMAAYASPGGWQLVLVGAAILLCAALATLLHHAYHPAGIWRRRVAFIVLGAGALLGLGATASLRAYGIAADQRAVIAWRAGTLRSIPTEADTTQKTTALPAGSMALQDEKTFLDWVRLTFDNGQTGWVRKADVIPIWR